MKEPPMLNSNPSFKNYGGPPVIKVDAVAPNHDQGFHTVAIWNDGCMTVDRLSAASRKQWPGAIVTMHHYGAGIRLRFRSDLDETLSRASSRSLGTSQRLQRYRGNHLLVT